MTTKAGEKTIRPGTMITIKPELYRGVLENEPLEVIEVKEGMALIQTPYSGQAWVTEKNIWNVLDKKKRG